MIEHIYNEWIQNIEKKIKNKTPLCNIEWFYDKENIYNQEELIRRVEGMLVELISILCLLGKVTEFYIRLHKYKEWYIIRIFMSKDLSQEIIKIVNEQLKKNKNSIVSIICDKRYTIIKLTL